MAKVKPQPSAPPAPPKALPTQSFRLERLSHFEYQAYRATRREDGKIVEEPFGKPSLANLVMARVFAAMVLEANESFKAGK